MADRKWLKLLWWEDGDISREPVAYQMTVHPFGACSSASIANHILQKVVQEETGDAKNVKGFYVDDCLRAAHQEGQLVETASELVSACSKGGFTLAKFVSNSLSVLRRVSSSVSDVSAPGPDLSLSDALGVQWDTRKDELVVDVRVNLRKFSKRTLLAGIAGVYDPLGVVGPCLLEGRIILQQLCRNQVDWDDPLSDAD